MEFQSSMVTSATARQYEQTAANTKPGMSTRGRSSFTDPSAMKIWHSISGGSLWIGACARVFNLDRAMSVAIGAKNWLLGGHRTSSWVFIWKRSDCHIHRLSSRSDSTKNVPEQFRRLCSQVSRQPTPPKQSIDYTPPWSRWDLVVP